MRSAIPVEQLDVIGYADSLDKDMRPSIVPPVFAFRSDTERLLVPPYGINSGFVCGATEIGRAELQDLHNAGEVTLIPNAVAAAVDFELWIDVSGKPHYEPRERVRDKLQDFAKRAVRKAKKAFRVGRVKKADRLCSAAIWADDRYLDAFALKAAIRRWENDTPGEESMARIVERSLDSESFRKLVDRFSNSNSWDYGASEPPSVSPMKDSATVH